MLISFNNVSCRRLVAVLWPTLADICTGVLSSYSADRSYSEPVMPAQFCASSSCLSWLATGREFPLRSRRWLDFCLDTLSEALWNEPDLFLALFSAASSFCFWICLSSCFFCYELTKEPPWDTVDGGN